MATANNADKLPPELKRKGRFDEIFCVNLPNGDERKAIFKVHLNKKACKKESIDYSMLVGVTDGFNGADIESVVNETVESCFLNEKHPLTTETLLDTARKTVSISMSCKKQIEDMKKAFSENCFKDATTGKVIGQNGRNNDKWR